MYKNRSFTQSSQAGFNLLELLVAIAIIGLMAVVTVEAVQKFIPRFEIEQAAGQTKQLIQRARIEAIKRGVRTVVEADLTGRSLRAFADLNGNPNNPLNPNGRYLVFDPDETLPDNRTDYFIGRTALPGKASTGSQFGGPQDGIRGADSISGLTPVPAATGAQTPVLVFRPSGAVMDPGGFRFTDSRGANHLEAFVTAFTGKVEIRKYLIQEDSPTGTADFFAEANETFASGSGPVVGKNIWVWY